MKHKLPYNPYTRAEKLLARELDTRRVRREMGMDLRRAPSKRAAKSGAKATGRTDIKDGRLMDMKFRPLKREAEFIY